MLSNNRLKVIILYEMSKNLVKNNVYLKLYIHMFEKYIILAEAYHMKTVL